MRLSEPYQIYSIYINVNFEVRLTLYLSVIPCRTTIAERKVGRGCYNFQLVIQIPPVWVHLFDQTQFPEPVPFLHAGFACAGALSGVVGFIPYQFIDCVIRGEFASGFGFMFPYPAVQTVRLTDIKRSIAFGRDDVNIEGHETILG